MSGSYFISYSRIDGAIAAKKIYDALQHCIPPIHCWWDKIDLRPTQVDWDDQIDDALADCRGVIFLMTPDSVQRNSVCTKEWKRAMRQYRKPVIPVLLARNINVPFALESRQCLLHDAGDIDIDALHDFLCWIDTPAGKVRETKDRIDDALRDHSRAENDTARERIEQELILLNAELDRWKSLVDNPGEVQLRREAQIRTSMELERQTTSKLGAAGSTKFINPPPALAPSHFQDRHAETRQTVEFIRDPSQRLLTIVGRGGIGKTALVCRLLKAMETGVLPDGLGELHVDGIVYLSGAGSYRITAPRLFSDLTRLLTEETARQLTEIYEKETLTLKQKFASLLEQFQSRTVVILFDNFEDLIDPETRQLIDSELRDVLSLFLELQHHGAKIVVTTRIPPAELALIEPGRQRRFDLDEGLPSPYAENILREMDADGKLGLKNASDSLLSEARERTRGYPRALEALFACLSVDRDTTLEELLADSNRYLPEVVVEKLVGDAYKRLDRSSQLVVQALAVYGRPVTPNAIDYMLLPYADGLDSAQILKRLTNMYFARREAGRYYLHPVDARHALQKVPPAAAGTERNRRTMTQRGADYFRQISKPEKSWESLADLEPILTEFELRCDAGEFETAARIISNISFKYLLRWGHYHLILSMNQKLREEPADLWLRAQCFGITGYAQRNLGHTQDAISSFERALQIAKQIGNQNSIATWLTNLGATCDELGQTDQSLNYHLQALKIDEQRGDLDGMGIDYHNLAGRYAELGELEKALDLIEKSIGIARQLKPQQKSHYDYAEGLRLGTLGQLLTDAGRFDEAIKHIETGLALADYLHSPEIRSRGYHFKSIALLGLNRTQDADSAAREAETFDFPRLQNQIVSTRGLTALCAGDRKLAESRFREAIAGIDRSLERDQGAYNLLIHRAFATCGLLLCGVEHQFEIAAEFFRSARQVNSHNGMLNRTMRWLDFLAKQDPQDQLRNLRPIALAQPSSI